MENKARPLSLDDLHRRYDGPIPEHEIEAALSSRVDPLARMIGLLEEACIRCGEHRARAEMYERQAQRAAPDVRDAIHRAADSERGWLDIAITDVQTRRAALVEYVTGKATPGIVVVKAGPGE